MERDDGGHMQFCGEMPNVSDGKSDQTLLKGMLQSTQIPKTKWSKISIDFMTDQPKSSRNCDSILVVVDIATKIIHMVPCSQGIIATNTTRLL